MKAVVKRADVRVLPIFEFMGKHVELEEMYRTFNMGVGMVLVVSAENVDSVLANTDGYVIGHIADGAKCVEFI